MSASKIFQEEGGTAEDVEPTQRLLRKKLLLGWPHVRFNEETERYDFLYVRKQHSEAFKQCWRAFQEGTKCGRSQAGEQAEEQCCAAAKVEKGQKKREAQTRDLPAKTCAGTQGKPVKKPKTRSSEANASEAMKAYNQAIVSGRQLLQWIEEGQLEWDWANSPKTIKPLKDAMEALEQASMNMNDFEKKYLMGGTDWKSMDTGEKDRMLSNMADKFGQLVKPVSDQLAWIRSNQALRKKLGLS